MLRDYYWLFGVVLVLGGSAISNLGLNLQKLTHVQAQAAAAAAAGQGGKRRREGGGGENEEEVEDGRELREAGDRLKTVVVVDRAAAVGDGDEDDEEDGLFASDDETVPLASPAGSTGAAASSGAAGSPSSGGAAGAGAGAGADAGAAGGEKPSYFTKPLWLLGLGLVVLGSVADFVALGFAAQTVVAPLGSFTLVTNVWFAQSFAGEKISARDLWATLTIIVGCVLSVAFASHSDRGYTFEELFAFYASPRFLAYAVVISSLVVTLYSAAQRLERRREAMLVSNSPAVLEFRRLGRMQRFYFGALSGIVGAQSVLFAKAFAELAREGIGSLWARYESYLIITGMCCCIFGQIKWMNEGLQRYDALYMVPCFQSFWIVFSVIGGLAVYREASEMSGSQAFFFALGISVTVYGVYLLSQRGGMLVAGEKEFNYVEVHENVGESAAPGASPPSSLTAAAAAAAAPAKKKGAVARSASMGSVRARGHSPVPSPAALQAAAQALPQPPPPPPPVLRSAANELALERERRRRRSRSDSLSSWLPNLAGQVADIRHDDPALELVLRSPELRPAAAARRPSAGSP